MSSGFNISRAAASPVLLARDVPTTKRTISKCAEAATERHAVRTDDLYTGRALVTCSLIALAGVAAASVSILADSASLELVAGAVATVTAAGVGFGAWRFYDRRQKTVDKELTTNLDRCSL